VWEIGLLAAVLIHYVNTIAFEYFLLSCRKEIRGDRDKKTEFTSMRIWLQITIPVNLIMRIKSVVITRFHLYKTVTEHVQNRPTTHSTPLTSRNASG